MAASCCLRTYRETQISNKAHGIASPVCRRRAPARIATRRGHGVGGLIAPFVSLSEDPCSPRDYTLRAPAGPWRRGAKRYDRGRDCRDLTIARKIISVIR